MAYQFHPLMKYAMHSQLMSTILNLIQLLTLLQIPALQAHQCLNPSKSAGHNHPSRKFIIKCAQTIGLLIPLLFKKSLITSGQKYNYVTPVHKKEPKPEIVNYRPISKLYVLVKVFERIIYDQVSITGYGWLCDTGYGEWCSGQCRLFWQ